MKKLALLLCVLSTSVHATDDDPSSFSSFTGMGSFICGEPLDVQEFMHYHKFDLVSMEDMSEDSSIYMMKYTRDKDSMFKYWIWNKRHDTQCEVASGKMPNI